MYTFASSLTVYPVVFLNHLLYRCRVANKFKTSLTWGNRQELQHPVLCSERLWSHCRDPCAAPHPSEPALTTKPRARWPASHPQTPSDWHLCNWYQGLSWKLLLLVRKLWSDQVWSELVAWESQAGMLKQSVLHFKRSNFQVCSDAIVKIAVFLYDLCLCKIRHLGVDALSTIAQTSLTSSLRSCKGLFLSYRLRQK